jgi:hypothetical protein
VGEGAAARGIIDAMPKPRAAPTTLFAEPTVERSTVGSEGYASKEPAPHCTAVDIAVAVRVAERAIAKCGSPGVAIEDLARAAMRAVLADPWVSYALHEDELLRAAAAGLYLAVGESGERVSTPPGKWLFSLWAEAIAERKRAGT